MNPGFKAHMLSYAIGFQKPIAIQSFTYDPDMPCWRFLKEHLTPALQEQLGQGFQLKDNGTTLDARIIGKDGLDFTFENRLRPLRDLADDSTTLRCLLFYGRNLGQYRGNAGPAGGSVECSICLEDEEHVNVCLSCMHRFHAVCLADHFGKGNFTCPNCRKEVVTEDLKAVKGWIEEPKATRGVKRSRE